MRKEQFFWNELKGTFWFFPALIIVLSVLLAVTTIYADRTVQVTEKGIGLYLFVSDASAAQSVLTTIAAAMISVAGTVFSVTLVALTLASNQLGPRLIRTFMYVRLNQVVIGLYVSTFLYCLIIQNSIQTAENQEFIPSISILVAILITIVNLLLLIVFIHRIATSIQADKVIADVATVLNKQLRKLFPINSDCTKSADYSDDLIAAKSHYSTIISIPSPQNGYIQYIEKHPIIEVLSKYDEMIEFNYRPGDYLVKGQEIAILYTNTANKKNELEDILKSMIIGQTKTEQQDLVHSINQIVEIALRALSSGVNDPNTAISCLNQLAAAICYLAPIDFPSKWIFDKHKKLRVIANTVDFETILDASFNQIRQSSSGSPAVLIRLMEILVITYRLCQSNHHKHAVQKHIDMTLRQGKESLKEKNDLNDLIKKAEKLDVQ